MAAPTPPSASVREILRAMAVRQAQRFPKAQRPGPTPSAPSKSQQSTLELTTGIKLKKLELAKALLPKDALPWDVRLNIADIRKKRHGHVDDEELVWDESEWLLALTGYIPAMVPPVDDGKEAWIDKVLSAAMDLMVRLIRMELLTMWSEEGHITDDVWENISSLTISPQNQKDGKRPDHGLKRDQTLVAPVDTKSTPFGLYGYPHSNHITKDNYLTELVEVGWCERGDSNADWKTSTKYLIAQVYSTLSPLSVG
ncbi:hypothetical protein PQX77_022294 [Marasmius sp. AFHP31]|nr:hypothetical protein PQX77_022294 [Marasmius sp. AFHP31]